MNIEIFNILNGLTGTNASFNSLAIFITTSFGSFLVIGTVFFLFLHKHVKNKYKNITLRLKEIFFVFFVIFMAWFLIFILKILFDLPRPFILFDIVPLVHASSGSFPSGHAGFFAALAASMWLYHPRTAWVYVPAAILIGISRIVVGVHFPVDIIAGWILGPALAFIFYYILRKKYRKYMRMTSQINTEQQEINETYYPKQY